MASSNPKPSSRDVIYAAGDFDAVRIRAPIWPPIAAEEQRKKQAREFDMLAELRQPFAKRLAEHKRQELRGMPPEPRPLSDAERDLIAGVMVASPDERAAAYRRVFEAGMAT